jgi:SAM-dependent methyltransferase
MVSPADVPAEVRSQQYSRCALYLSHIEFARKHIAPRLREGLTAIEFGGSNGFLAELLDGVTYEVAPNAPAVDVQDLSSYPADEFDLVVLDEILEHVARPWVAVEEARRILKPGGCLVTSSPFLIAEHRMPKDYWRFTKDGYRVLLENYSTVDVHSWGNPGSVTYLMQGMMVSTQDAIDAGTFDLTDVEKFAISVWAYAWK